MMVLLLRPGVLLLRSINRSKTKFKLRAPEGRLLSIPFVKLHELEKLMPNALVVNSGRPHNVLLPPQWRRMLLRHQGWLLLRQKPPHRLVAHPLLLTSGWPTSFLG